MIGLSLLFGLLVIVGCVPINTATPSPAPTPHLCGPFTVITREASLTCLEKDKGLLLQAIEGESVSMSWINGDVTFSGTMLYYPYPADQSLTETLTSLDGTMLVSLRGQTRIVPVGAQIILSLDDAGSVQNVSPQPLPYDVSRVNPNSLMQLPRPLTLPTPIAPPEGYIAAPACTGNNCPAASGASQPDSALCTVRDDWEETRVQPGENLSGIASRFGLTAADLQKANCLNNPNRLQIGQILHVPPYETATPLAQPTFTPSVVAFRADSTLLALTECTTLRWDVQNISAVFIDEQPTTGSGILPVCPSTTTTYRLRVVYPDGTQSQHPLIITISEGTP